ncbi:MAG: FtsX-like permease family protein, partial [Ilumatobacteraceae bacterium]
MAFRSTALIARKSIRARLGRTIAITVAIMAGVSFVVGSFVLADSLRAVFDDLFAELSEDVDLEVRSAQEFDDSDGNAREPIDVTIAADIDGIDGIAVIEPTRTRYAQLIDDEGEAVTPAGGPTRGVSWEGEDGIQGVTVKEGVAPDGSAEVAIDKATADREDIVVGDRITYLTDTGQHMGTVSALIGLGDADSFGGASLVALDLETALDRFGAEGKVDAIDIKLADGASESTVRAEIEQILPPRTEVVTGEEVAEESAEGVNQFIDIFGIGLLIFAGITAFVSTFIINNVFQISIGQRLRELALLRAVGASRRQVGGMITAEALIQAIIATALGILGGVLVARLIVFGFNSAGAGFPTPDTILAARTILIAILVGVLVTLASVIVPAYRASRIPPVAAMRPELGFSALRAKRLIVGGLIALVGLVAFVYGLFGDFDNSIWVIIFAGGGGLLIFVGVASLSSTVARPVTSAIGWPIEKLFKVPGALARQNVARAPRRTSSSASALMSGGALVSAAAVFASSSRATFVATLE